MGGIATRAPASLPAAQLESTLGHLWESLLVLDDLSVSAAPVMAALASYCAALHYPALDRIRTPSRASCLAHTLPRLWPLLRHPSAAARLAAVRTLAALAAAVGSAASAPMATSADGLATSASAPASSLAPVSRLALSAALDASCFGAPAGSGPWAGGCAPSALAVAMLMLVQAVLLDGDAQVHLLAADALATLVAIASPSQLRRASAPHLTHWLAMLSTPLDQPIALRGVHRPRFAPSTDHASASSSAGALGATSSSSSPPVGTAIVADDIEPLPFEVTRATSGMHERGSAVLGALAAACDADGADGINESVDDCSWRSALADGLGAASATARQLAALVVSEWALSARTAVGRGPGAMLKDKVLQLASDAPAVAATASEMRAPITAMQV